MTDLLDQWRNFDLEVRKPKDQNITKAGSGSWRKQAWMMIRFWVFLLQWWPSESRVQCWNSMCSGKVLCILLNLTLIVGFIKFMTITPHTTKVFLFTLLMTTHQQKYFHLGVPHCDSHLWIEGFFFVCLFSFCLSFVQPV